MNRQIIITGGLGYIGSHTIVELKDYFDEFIVIDDLSNSNLSVICQLEKLTGKIFREEDENILNYIDEDGTLIEPDYYTPIIPTILINGCSGIGTGFSTSITSFNPIDVITNIKLLLNK